jgi:hypothetical protein
LIPLKNGGEMVDDGLQVGLACVNFELYFKLFFHQNFCYMKKIARTNFKFLLLCPLVVLATAGNCQDSAHKFKLPYMWTEHGNFYVGNFLSDKLFRMQETGIEHPSSLYLGNFLGMIEYFESKYAADFEFLHVYIATFGEEGSPMVPIRQGNKLTLIFAPASSKGDLGDFFNIPPTESFAEDQLDKFIVNSYQGEWRDKFVNDVMPHLVLTIDGTKDSNQIAHTPSDTRCITYCRASLDQLIAEKKRIHTDGTNSREFKFSTDMVARFSSFGKHGDPLYHKYARRLFVQFEFVDDSGRVITLEKTYKYSTRGQLKNPCPGPYGAKGNDNGTLCPPCTNCPPGFCTKKTKG